MSEEARPETVESGPKVKPKCIKCLIRAQGKNYRGLCRRCYDEKNKVVIPADLAEKAARARSKEDWQEIYNSVAPAISAIAQGTQKASTAQVSLLKEIMSRAFGKVPTAVEQKTKIATGLVVLPTLSTGEHSLICPRCGWEVTKDVESGGFSNPESVVEAQSGPTDSVSIVNG